MSGRSHHSTQTGRHSAAARGLELYETRPVAVEKLLNVENLPHLVWEPAAGRGAIVNILRLRGHTVVASDIVERDGLKLDFVADFLKTTKAPAGCDTVLTNPPFSLAGQFVAHALDLVPHVIVLAPFVVLRKQMPHRNP